MVSPNVIGLNGFNGFLFVQTPKNPLNQYNLPTERKARKSLIKEIFL